jgi:hypothetical protein
MSATLSCPGLVDTFNVRNNAEGWVTIGANRGLTSNLFSKVGEFEYRSQAVYNISL